MPIRDTQINLELEKFFRWWGGELAFLVPERLRELFASERPRLVLTKAADGFDLTFVTSGLQRGLGQFRLDEDGPGKRERLFDEQPELREAELLLRLSADQALTRVVKLPAAAEENLQQVVAFEMDRWTPFKADQVYYSARVIERLQDTRQVRVEIALTPRQKLDPIIDEVLSYGWVPERVDVGPEIDGRGHNLLPDKFKPEKNRLPLIATAAAGVVCAVLLLGVFVVPITMNRALMEDLQSELKHVSKAAKDVEALKNDVEKLQKESSFLARRKMDEPATVDMLNELTKVIPDDTWLNGLQYRDRKVVMQGQSPAASSLIEKIEASTFFKNTSFVSPVTKDVASGQERFQIASEVLNGRTSEKPAE